MAKIAVVDSIHMDLVVHAPRYPAPGETVPGSSFAPPIDLDVVQRLLSFGGEADTGASGSR